MHKTRVFFRSLSLPGRLPGRFLPPGSHTATPPHRHTAALLAASSPLSGASSLATIFATDDKFNC